MELLFTAKWDPFAQGILLRCEYSEAKHSNWHVKRILATILQVLECIVSQPHTRLSDLELMNERDYQECNAWNRIVPQNVEKPVQELIAEHVHAAPLNPAVDAWDGKLSYAELDDASTKVAHHLVQMGVGPESTVPLFFDKSIWNIVATVGVLKAGGAFVPLDPSQPDSRISHILKQVQANVILSSETHRERLIALSDVVLCLDKSWLESTPSPLGWSLTSVRPWNLAYIIFTSGSTGEPKGVMIEHSACSASIVAHGRATGFNKNTRAVQYARHTFDASIAEILTTLAFGGCVVVPSEDERMNNISAIIQRKQVNWAFFTPSLIRLLDPYELPGLRTVVLGGEAVGQDNIEKWAPRRNLVIAYGPTENTVFSTMYRASPTEKANIIGRGLGTLCWIADPDDPTRLSPLGSIGELLLESPQLARGYLNFAENEGPNKAFIRDPPWLTKNGRRARLYRTGDLCRFDENGVIHFEGRKDTQLKISGQRLEAAEVEHHLRAAFGTNDIVVDVLKRPNHGSEQQSKVLVAFVCLEKPISDCQSRENYIMPRQLPALQERIPTVENEISKRLPSWMWPSVYIPLISLPLSPNGKADVKRLRQEASGLTPEQFYSYTQGNQRQENVETERQSLMRGLWGEILGVPKDTISTNSNFFRLGGDSLAAIGLAATARRKGLHLDYAQIFNNPILNDLCQLPLVEAKRKAASVRPLTLLGENARILNEVAEDCSISIEDIEDVFPCTSLQEGLMALSSTTENSFLAQYILHLPVNTDVARLKMAWETVAKAYGILRTRLVDTSAAGIQQVVVQERLAWNESFNLDEYLEMDLKQPSSFGAPLNRFGIVYDASGNASRMVWTVHHAITDGHSVGVTLRAVRDAFQGALRPSETSFSSFIQYCKSMDMEAATKYWESIFQDVDCEPFPKRPPTTTRTSSNQGSAFVRRKVPVPSSETGATTTTILRAAWALVVSRFSGSKYAVFGVTSSGRNASFDGIEAVPGPTIATVPLRVNCDEKKFAQDLLESLQMNSVNMIPFEQIGVQNIARISPTCQAACEFQSMIIVQPEVDMATDGAPFTAFDRPQDLDKFNSYAIMVECTLQKDAVLLNVNYDIEYLDSLQMERLLDYFENALAFLVSSEAHCIEELTRQPTIQDLIQLREWNNLLPETVEACVHHQFEEHATTRPTAQAVFAWDGCLSFSELDRRASQLAQVLVESGVDLEKKVAYCFEKSMYTVISMLAILKAGGTMVPLDPAHPPERKSFIIRSINADVVLASTTSAAFFHNMDVPVVVVNSALFSKLDETQAMLFSSTRVQPHNAATVLFTSGSTGAPKGVVQEHKTLCSAAKAHSEGMQMFKGSRILQFSAHVFDVSVIEIVNALILGACICIPSEEDRTSDLAGFVSRSEANWAFLTPSFARTLDPTTLPSLKTVCMGGEAMTLDNIQTWAGNVQLINSYGPCEGSVCTVANLSKGQFSADSIGQGLNCLVWIVDPNNHDKLLPIGSIGEILIEGPNIARGYLGDAEKTNKAFITNPAWMANFETNGTDRRMYKTGDLGRFNSDGSISYLGRKDTQIKLRGQRIEPGEIEYQIINSLPNGSSAAVDALLLPGSHTKSLVAFIQLQGQEATDGLASRLKLQLSSVLPAYMVPSHFLFVDTIPFGPTGKLDRRRLEAYASTLNASEEPTTASADERQNDVEDANVLRADEEIALAISSKLTDLLSGPGDARRMEKLRGRNFNPFYAGMDSIQVISLSTFVRKTYNVSLPVQKYMNSAATIRDIAKWIAEDRHVTQHEDGVDLLREIDIYDESLASLHPQSLTHPPITKTPQIIFLTGATGFLGNALLAQLLKRPETRKVIALVRGTNVAHANERLFSSVRGSSWWNEAYASRLEVWHGDLSLPKLGLKGSQWSRLDGSSADGDLVEAVVHNGAVVNWMADYSALTSANILSTVNLLTAVSQATATRPIRFTYVSGGHLSTLPDNVHEIAQELKTYPAYSQTKFVAEVLVERYANRLAQAGCEFLVTIVKPGLIMGSSSDGISNTDDFLWRVTASALDIGVCPNDQQDLWIAAAGVDLVAQITLDDCFRKTADGKHQVVKKILNGITMEEYWDIVAQETRQMTRPTNTEDWLRTLRGDVESKGSGHYLWPVMHFLEDKGGKLGQPIGQMTSDDQLEHKDAVEKALRRSLQYLVAIGYINSSRASSEDGDSTSEPTLLVPGSVVFSRTPTTPVWDQAADSKRLGYGGDSDGLKPAVSISITPLRSPSPLAETRRAH
nr:non-ribosomal peptide synthetase [Colletotrichum truncatum]KAF6788334.1 non-ribosomal peptide synthetase [Colletotrichum truncatum]